jgi:DNA-binding response OmpR family regulator
MSGSPPDGASEIPRILITDDDPRMVRLLSLSFPPDFEILQTRNGQESIAIAEAKATGLMLLDVNMPGLNGFEVLQRARSSSKLKKTRMIMVTARSDDVNQNLGMDLGADAYLTKPFSPLTLLEEINRILAKSR